MKGSSEVGRRARGYLFRSRILRTQSRAELLRLPLLIWSGFTGFRSCVCVHPLCPSSSAFLSWEPIRCQTVIMPLFTAETIPLVVIYSWKWKGINLSAKDVVCLLSNASVTYHHGCHPYLFLPPFNGHPNFSLFPLDHVSPKS